MKKYLLIFALLLGALSSRGQSSSDQAAILQKCIDLPALQTSFPVDANGQGVQVNVLQPKFQFPANLAVTKFNKPLRFLSKSDIYSQDIKQVLYIDRFEVGSTKANVILIYYHNFTGSGSSEKVIIQLDKTGNSWEVVTSNVEKK